MSEVADASEGVAAPTESESAVVETTEVESSGSEAVSQTESESPDQGEGSSPDESADAGEKPEKRNRYQERITQLVNRGKEAEERAQEAEQRLRLLEQQLKQSGQQAPQRPKLEDFEYDEARYNEALAEYYDQRSSSNLNSALANQQRQEAQMLKQQAQQAIVETFRERVNAFAEDHPDFHQVVTNPQIPLNRNITNTLMFDDNGPAVAYHLAKNPQLAMEISQMPAPRAAMELGKISSQLSAPVAPRTTQAPPPPKPPKATGSSVQKDPDKMTPAEYARWRGYRK